MKNADRTSSPDLQTCMNTSAGSQRQPGIGRHADSDGTHAGPNLQRFLEAPKAPDRLGCILDIF